MDNKGFSEKFGPWAVVTGASSGIGVGFAHALAGKGMNLALVARRENMLKKLAHEVEGTYRVKTAVIPADLSQPGSIQGITAATDELDVGLLVSNAGAASMGALLRVDVEALAEKLRLNTEAHLRLTHHYGNRLVRKGRGGIILVGSMGGEMNMPFGANYAAAKSYIHTLGQAVNFELKDTGVNVSVLVPGSTRTPGLTDRTDIDMSKVPGPVMEVDKLVKIGLKGLAKNKPLVIPGGPIRMMDFMSRRILPRHAMRNKMGKDIGKQTPKELQVQR